MTTAAPKEGSMPTADREGLREALAQHFDGSAFLPAYADCRRYYQQRRDDALKRADALIAGPLADLLAQADTAAQAVAERDEARVIALNHASALDDLGQEYRRAMAEAKAQRLPHMCRDGHSEIRHADSGDDERCPVCQERDRAEAALAEVARLSAEVEARDEVLRDLKAWIDTELEPGTPGAMVAHKAIWKALAAGQDKEGGKPAVPTPQKDRDHG